MYAKEDGLRGMVWKESKLASYWNTPFTKICLGMSYNGDQKWMAFDYTASSLYDVIADGQFKPTNAGRDAWKSLIAGSSLQQNCRKEGFNMAYNLNSHLRLGIIANNENNCLSVDSWIGFSASSVLNGKWTSHMVSGNRAKCCYSDNGEKLLPTFGYIFVQ
jgi:hypothetical protein